MSSIDNILNDPEHQNWIKRHLCTEQTKKGLEKFAEQRSIALHNHILWQLRGTIAAGLTCAGSSIRSIRGRWKISCCNSCQLYVDEALKEKTNHFVFSKQNWNNSDPQHWPHKPWELTKIYMNPGQKRTLTTPEDTDLCGILNLIDHCNFFYRDIGQPGNIHKVIYMTFVPLY